jgi:UDP-N-acetylmuramyl pentapeptide phosphotransferase/UDP-N-acetylglucosamine-1-phosphate transferase
MIGLDIHRLVFFAIVAATAAPVCAGLIKLVFPLLRRYAMARPNARSSHIEPTPQGAGIAVIATVLSITAATATLNPISLPIAVFGGTLFIGLVGLLDDLRPMPVLPRLILQAIAVGVVLFCAPADLRIMPSFPIGIERGLLFLAGIWFVNLVNFMDGLDLMTAAEVVPITGAMVLLGSTGEFPAFSTIIAAALLGAMLGFAPFNRPVAKVFLGDVGSLPIGLLLGWCLLQLAWHHHFVAALLLPLYYLADATTTLLRRIARREAFWAAHRSHFYQQATKNGFTVQRVVTEVFVLNVVLAGLAVASVSWDSVRFDSLVGLVGVAAVAWQLYRFSRKWTQ